MKTILLVILILVTHWPEIANSSEKSLSPSLSKLFVGNRGYIILAQIDDFGKLESRMAESDIDLVVRSKLDPEHQHGYVIVRATVERVFTNTPKPKSIDVAVPVVMINGTWQQLLDTKALRNRAFFLVDEMTVGLQNLNSLMLTRIYSDDFEKELIKEIAAVEPLRPERAPRETSGTGDSRSAPGQPPNGPPAAKPRSAPR